MVFSVIVVSGAGYCMQAVMIRKKAEVNIMLLIVLFVMSFGNH